MHAKAMGKARAAFARAEQSLTALKESNDFPSIETHWEAFLDNASKVFTRLEQAANATSKGKAWWGSQVRQWKQDPLLLYIRQARDATNHSIQEVARVNPGYARPVDDPSPEELEHVHKEAQELGLPYAVLGGCEVVWPHVECVDVSNKGTMFPRPTSHLGGPTTTNTPADIGDLALLHLAKMIRETESFA